MTLGRLFIRCSVFGRAEVFLRLGNDFRRTNATRRQISYAITRCYLRAGTLAPYPWSCSVNWCLAQETEISAIVYGLYNSERTLLYICGLGLSCRSFPTFAQSGEAIIAAEIDGITKHSLSFRRRFALILKIANRI